MPELTYNELVNTRVRVKVVNGLIFRGRFFRQNFQSIEN